MIALKQKDGTVIHVNPSQICFMATNSFGGTCIRFSGGWIYDADENINSIVISIADWMRLNNRAI